MRIVPILPLFAMLACAAPAPVPAAPAPPPSVASSAPPPAPTPSSPPRAVESAAASASAAPAPPPPAVPVARAGKVWPFHDWNRAEAISFNRFDMRSGVPLRVIDDKGWSPHLGERKPLAIADARRAVEWIERTDGDVAVSKCAFPRHAVVLYDGDVPVASINVCFECGDILLWPSWKPDADGAKMPDTKAAFEKERKILAAREAKQRKAYDDVFPEWKRFFRDEVGFPLAGR